MKKIYFNLVAIIFLSQIASAQLSLSQTNFEPTVGDTNKAYLVDTGLVNIKTINAVTGSNALWDFSSLSVIANSITSTVYSSTTSASSATNFPGCTFVQSNSSFFKSVTTPSAQTELLGGSLIGASLNFTNSAIVLKYPFAYSNNYTDSYSGTVTYTSNGTFSGSITVNADGTGTLNLPGGQVFTNVLRVKTTQNTTANNVIPFIPITIKVTNYDYYHASQKYPIFNVNYNSIAILTPTVSATIRANTKSTIVGLKENSLLDQNLLMYPNPAKDYFNLNLSNATSEMVLINIYNAMGQLVKTINLGNEAVIQKNIVISDLKSGIYIIKTSAGTATSTKRLVIE
ncbi:MAG: T9SS type A sorting domain-containing protein [Bacteroidota bacterium]|nr:T9SS type A sorting domain-containing protein [Bacteroidota bacterium]